jgi:Ca2+-binding EF-hand superfamily protein
MTSTKQRNLLSERHIAYISKHTNASKDDIALLLNELVLDHPDGKMCKNAFRKWLTTMAIKPKEKPDASVEMIQDRVFRRFDKDGKGVIDFQEFVTVIYIMTNGQEKAENIFDLFDADQDGELTKQELGAVWHKIFKSKDEFEKMFDEMDSDKNGTITKEEFTSFYPKLKAHGAWTTTL